MGPRASNQVGLSERAPERFGAQDVTFVLRMIGKKGAQTMDWRADVKRRDAIKGRVFGTHVQRVAMGGGGRRVPTGPVPVPVVVVRWSGQGSSADESS